MRDKKEILFVGSYSNGGIASVINSFLNSELSNYIIFKPSYIEASTLYNWLRFFIFIFDYSFTLLINRNIKLVHLLSAEKGSFLRKSILLVIAKLFGKKTIINFHSCNPNIFFKDDNFPFNIFIKSILNKADIILVLSSQWQKIIQRKCSNKNIQVLYNPINIKTLSTKISNNINVLFLGIMGQRKGAYDIIETAKLLDDENIKILMYGNGEVTEIQNLVEKYNLQSKIKVGGWIGADKVDEAYRNADLMILPSYNEGLPMTLLEAASYGLPSISTNVGGIPDIIIEGINGFLITPGDYKALAEKIKILVSDKELRKNMGQESYKVACEKFDINKVVSKLIYIYTSLLTK